MIRLVRRLICIGGPLALISAVALTGAAGAQDAPDLEAERQRIAAQQVEAASQVNLLTASEAEVAAALATLDSALSEQRAAVVAASQSLVAARQQVTDARRNERVAVIGVARAQSALRRLAVAAYLHPPVADLLPAIMTGTMEEAPKRRVYAEVRVHQLDDAIGALETTRADVARRRAEMEAAEDGAAAAQATAQARLADLEVARDAQAQAAVQVEDRLERALAEVSTLAAQDSVVAEAIQRRQAELVAAAATAHRVAGEAEAARAEAQAQVPVAAVAVRAPADDSPGPTVLAGPDPGDGAVETPTPVESNPVESPVTSPPVTNPPVTTPRPTYTPVDTTWVGGIEVATVIAGQVEALLAAAAADGLVLTGSGYRNIEDQISIRREVCGPTDYDIWDKPSWECSPPVARPGRSNHEKGLAIDFTGPNGDLVRTQDSPTFAWLSVNAVRFGLYNLPSEPWHWSTTGG